MRVRWIRVGSTILTFAGVFVGALASLWASLRPAEKRASWVAFAGALIAAGGAWWSAVEQGELLDRTARLAQANAHLAEKGFGYATGGSTYPRIDLLWDAREHSWQVILLAHGEYPLFDVDVALVDLDAPSGSAPVGSLRDSFTREQPNRSTLHVGTLHAMRGRRIGQVTASTGSRNLNFNVAARNGEFFQFARLRCVSGRWELAQMIFTTEPGRGEERRVLCVNVDEGYPRRPAGSVEWDFSDTPTIGYSPSLSEAPRCWPKKGEGYRETEAAEARCAE